MKRYDVAIVGAGTAGLSARREVAKQTENYVVIDDGPLGTTCARVGCMPSKVLIQVAQDFHRREAFGVEGILGAEGLAVDPKRVMAHVRSLRDRFVRAVRADMASFEDRLIRKRARFVDHHTLDLGDTQIQADHIVLATGSKPVIPSAWSAVRHRLVDTDQIFEWETWPERIAVVGLGVIGLELGQALARLGSQVVGFTPYESVGGLTDKEIAAYAFRAMASEFPLHRGRVDRIWEADGALHLQSGAGDPVTVDKALVAMGRRPNLEGLGIEALGLDTESGLPKFDPNTFRILDTPWYIAGDVNGTRPILHEASDEGRIAGYNAVHEEDQCFRRRTKLAITFSAPNIAIVGSSHRELEAEGADFVTGSVSYEGQGRAIVKHAEKGLLHVYADRRTGRLLGAELFAPDGEHLAHLISWAMASDLTVHQALSLPFYHPVTAEGLRTALRSAAQQLAVPEPPLEVLRCADPPVGVLA